MNAYEVTLNVNDHEVTMPIEANTPAEAQETAKERLDERIARLLTEINACGHIPLKVEPVYVEPGERRYRATCTAAIKVEFTAPGDFNPEDVGDQFEAEFDLCDLSTRMFPVSLVRDLSNDDVVDVEVDCSVMETQDTHWKFEEVKS
jgi:hypothetical protein